MANKFILNQEDGTVEGGNIRGIGSVDLQTSRTAADQVASGDYSVIGCGLNNIAATGGAYGSFIGGGIGNSINTLCAESCFNVIVGGASNSIQQLGGGGNRNTYYGFIGGGCENRMGQSAAASIGGVLVGGLRNTVYRQGAIVGGQDNQSASDGFIGGGCCNNATDGGIIAGIKNLICGNSGGGHGSFIGAGCNNTVSLNKRNFIGAGQNNNAAGCISGILAGAGNVTSLNYNGIGSGISNTVSADQTFIGAGCCNVASGLRSFIGAGRSNVASGDQSFVGAGGGQFTYSANRAQCTNASVVAGCANNVLSVNSAIVNGFYNQVDADNSIIGGGYCNFAINTTCSAYAFGSAVVGGVGNNTTGGTWDDTTNTFTANPTPQNAGKFSFVGGGRQNVACADYSSIVSGNDNIARSYGTFIGGGSGNQIGCSTIPQCTCFASIVGGLNNCVFGNTWSGTGNNAGGFIGGGENNCVFQSWGSIVGGCNNVVAYSSGGPVGSSILGGINNTNGGKQGAILGGDSNVNSGCRSTILNGCLNTISGGQVSLVGGICNTITGGGNGNGIFTALCSSINDNSTSSAILAGWNNTLVGRVQYSAIVSGTGNKICTINQNWPTAADVIGGGQSNLICGDYTANNGILSGRCNSISGANICRSFIGAGQSNTITSNFSAILGGQSNYVTADNSIIGGGQCNFVRNTTCSAYAFGSAVVGGAGNNTTGGTWDDTTNTFTVAPTPLDAGKFSFVGGGRQNVAWGINSTVGGGTNNKACGCYSTIAGGVDNGTYVHEGEYSFIGGGCCNFVLRDYGVVAGGQNNNNQGIFGFIGAGCDNTVSGTNPGVIVGGKNNTATGGLILGGTNNTAASCASVGGGNNNASGGSSTVFGFASCATNSYAVALGYESRTTAGCSSVLGGYGNGNDGQNSSIGGGWRNCITSNAPCSFIGGGCCNRTNAGFSTIHGGTYNCTDGVFSIASGNRSRATLYGQKSHASGNFNAVGDAQVSTLVARAEGQLTASSGLPLFLDGATELIVPLGTNRAWNVTVDWVAIVQAVIGATGIAVGDIISQKDTFGYKRILGTGSIVGTPTTVATFSDASMTSSSVTYTASAGGNLDIRFDAPSFGAGDVIFNVVARVSLTEVAIP